MVFTKISRNALKNYILFRERCLNLYFCGAFKVILILQWIGNYEANKPHNFWRSLNSQQKQTRKIMLRMYFISWFFKKSTMKEDIWKHVSCHDQEKLQCQTHWIFSNLNPYQQCLHVSFLQLLAGLVDCIPTIWQVKNLTKCNEKSSILTSILAGFFWILLFSLDS